MNPKRKQVFSPKKTIRKITHTGGVKMYDVAVIGAGIVGAACAYDLSKYDLKIAVLEKKNDVCCGTTKANSAIIHAG